MSTEGHPDQSMWDMTHAGTEPGANRMKVKIKDVISVLEARGLEPVGAICDVLPELSPAMKVKTLLGLAEFVYPKLGRTVVAGDADNPLQTSLTVTFK